MQQQPARHEYTPPAYQKERFLRLKDVLARTGLSRSTVYLLINHRQFPQQILLGPRCVGWLETEIEDWIRMRTNLSRHAT
jgi:prophage regulatory protein